MSVDYRSPRAVIESGPVTIPELFEWNARENPEYPLFRFRDSRGALKTITYTQAIGAIRRIARYVLTLVGSAERCAVAILANTDSVTYTITSVGILRAGHIVFPISTRNGSAAVSHLLNRTNCRHLLVSEDGYMQTLASEATRDTPGITLHSILNFDEIFGGDAVVNDCGTEDLPNEFNINDVGMILHSSGSTNHPKPIYWTHKRMTSRGTTSWYGEVDLTGITFACPGTPMFHAQGVSFYLTSVVSGLILGVFPPASPPIFPTPENVFENAVASGGDYVVAFPPFVEEWARDPVKVDKMQKMKGVIIGGAPLKEEVGNALASRGIALIMWYGVTEVGAVANVIPANPGMDWGYFSITPWVQSTVLDAGDGKFEIVVLSSSEDPHPVVNTKIGCVDGYATNDLVVPHPTRKGLWKMYGRRDDQIVLSNGEKTNPLPLERIIKGDINVYDCLVFGNLRSQNGVLVEPEAAFAFDPQDQTLLAEFRNRIWTTIERANADAPQHSRIFKEMVIVTSPSKPFDYNAKGDTRRNPILERYKEEIDALYAGIEESAQSDIIAPSHWDSETAKRFIRTVVQKVLLKPLDDESDIFRSGCDSLQATWIRNTILRALRDVSGELPMDFVYQAPSIAALTDVVLHAALRDDKSQGALSAQDLVKVAESYSADFPPRPAQLRQRGEGKDVILITGTTRGFGCDVLEHLLRSDEVSTVYAFNRKGSRPMDRQLESFRTRGLEEDLLKSVKLVMVEAELDIPGFGLDDGLLSEIRDSVTHIMHNAWKVDFNLALPSYEVDLKAVRNLIQLSLGSSSVSPPRIQFISSVGVLRNCGLQQPIHEEPLDPSSALGNGYSEAKWIAECILCNVAEQHNVPISIVRLGQVCGDRSGYWNEKEWFPAMIKSALSTRCLPDLEAVVSFIPSYPSARAFVEMRNSPSLILHLSHPRPVPWHTLMVPIAEELRVPLVPFPDWLASLEKCDNETLDVRHIEWTRNNPALRLLGLFRSWTSTSDPGPVSAIRLSTEKAEAASETLAGLPALDAEVARRWVAGWRRAGFLP
ncbi:acetyl-CoA synthetase-like protein [Ganoderma leucocontextum]|nr:acetyl-CoA synthetase-like protein [Ganoderma leucocontextum]